MSLANISIVGNLTREPEQKHFNTGRTKTTLIVAVNSIQGIRKEKKTDFYKVETWDRLADLAQKYLKKGNQVAVSGRFLFEHWIDREGKDRTTPTVQANQLALPQRSKPDPVPSAPALHAPVAVAPVAGGGQSPPAVPGPQVVLEELFDAAQSVPSQVTITGAESAAMVPAAAPIAVAASPPHEPEKHPSTVYSQRLEPEPEVEEPEAEELDLEPDFPPDTDDYDPEESDVQVA